MQLYLNAGTYVLDIYVSLCISLYLSLYLYIYTSKYIDTLDTLKDIYYTQSVLASNSIDDVRFCRLCCAGAMQTSSWRISPSRPLRRVHGPSPPSAGFRYR